MIIGDIISEPMRVHNLYDTKNSLTKVNDLLKVGLQPGMRIDIRMNFQEGNVKELGLQEHWLWSQN